MPLSFAPGEAYQFDWSHEIVVIAGVTTTVKVLGVLLDVRRTEGTARLLVLDADLPEAQPITFTVEASADLKGWRPVAEKVVYRATAPGAGGGIALPLDAVKLHGDYLRILWRGASRPLSPVTIRRATLATRDDGTMTSGSIAATTPSPTNAHTLEFLLPFAVPASTIRVVPTGGEMIVPVRILGRTDREQPWTLLGKGTAARQSAARSSGGIALGVRAYGMLRIEADPHSAGFSAAPAITFDFPRQELVFLAIGTPPYVLAVGRAATSPAYLPLASLMTQATENGLAVATAGTAAGATILQLQPITDNRSGRQALLWGLLISATAILGWMAWLLWRGGDAAS